MEKELLNVLKFDFYSEKMVNYHELIINSINHLIQFRGFKLISEEFFNEYWDYFGSFYVELVEKERQIHYKYSNMMNQIFDLMVDGDERHVYEDYISDKKVKLFNRDLEKFEIGCVVFYETLGQLLDELHLAKRFTTDMDLLNVLEDEFSNLLRVYEELEEIFSSFENTIDIQEE